MLPFAVRLPDGKSWWRSLDKVMEMLDLLFKILSLHKDIRLDPMSLCYGSGEFRFYFNLVPMVTIPNRAPGKDLKQKAAPPPASVVIGKSVFAAARDTSLDVMQQGAAAHIRGLMDRVSSLSSMGRVFGFASSKVPVENVLKLVAGDATLVEMDMTDVVADAPLDLNHSPLALVNVTTFHMHSLIQLVWKTSGDIINKALSCVFNATLPGMWFRYALKAKGALDFSNTAALLRAFETIKFFAQAIESKGKDLWISMQPLRTGNSMLWIYARYTNPTRILVYTKMLQNTIDQYARDMFEVVTEHFFWTPQGDPMEVDKSPALTHAEETAQDKQIPLVIDTKAVVPFATLREQTSAFLVEDIGANAPAARVWEHIAAKLRLSSTIDVLHYSYDVGPKPPVDTKSVKVVDCGNRHSFVVLEYAARHPALVSEQDVRSFVRQITLALASFWTLQGLALATTQFGAKKVDDGAPVAKLASFSINASSSSIVLQVAIPTLLTSSAANYESEAATDDNSPGAVVYNTAELGGVIMSALVPSLVPSHWDAVRYVTSNRDDLLPDLNEAQMVQSLRNVKLGTRSVTSVLPGGTDSLTAAPYVVSDDQRQVATPVPVVARLESVVLYKVDRSLFDASSMKRAFIQFVLDLTESAKHMDWVALPNDKDGVGNDDRPMLEFYGVYSDELAALRTALERKAGANVDDPAIVAPGGIVPNALAYGRYLVQAVAGLMSHLPSLRPITDVGKRQLSLSDYLEFVESPTSAHEKPLPNRSIPPHLQGNLKWCVPANITPLWFVRLNAENIARLADEGRRQDNWLQQMLDKANNIQRRIAGQLDVGVGADGSLVSPRVTDFVSFGCSTLNPSRRKDRAVDVVWDRYNIGTESEPESLPSWPLVRKMLRRIQWLQQVADVRLDMQQAERTSYCHIRLCFRHDYMSLYYNAQLPQEVYLYLTGQQSDAASNDNSVGWHLASASADPTLPAYYESLGRQADGTLVGSLASAVTPLRTSLKKTAGITTAANANRRYREWYTAEQQDHLSEPERQALEQEELDRKRQQRRAQGLGSLVESEQDLVQLAKDLKGIPARYADTPLPEALWRQLEMYKDPRLFVYALRRDQLADFLAQNLTQASYKRIADAKKEADERKKEADPIK